MPVVNGIAAAIALGSAHPHYVKFVELLVDSHSSANKTGDKSSEDDEDDEENYTYGYNRFIATMPRDGRLWLWRLVPYV